MSTAGRNNLMMALSSIRATKWRSLLTILGVVIGVASVVTVFGIGEGVKQQVAGQIDHFGNDLIVVLPGKQQSAASSSNPSRLLSGVDVLFGRDATGALSSQDATAVANIKQVAVSAPLGILPGTAKADGTTLNDPLIIATNSQLPDVIGQHLHYGSFFDNDSTNTAVIGSQMAHSLFGESVPLGQLFTLRSQTFMVRGIFSDFNSSPLSPTTGFDNAIFISSQAGNQLTNNALQFYTILARPITMAQQPAAIGAITSRIAVVHGGEHDFTVLNRNQAEDIGNGAVNLVTAFIMAVGIIALLVGGIGIMNIMLVSVTERMHEIGVRKAVGATNNQILGQFTLEAAVLSVTGGVLGVGIAIIVELLLRTYSSYKPVLLWRPVLIATGISLLIGIIFGVAPAIKAARKDPISALRHE